MLQMDGKYCPSVWDWVGLDWVDRNVKTDLSDNKNKKKKEEEKRRKKKKRRRRKKKKKKRRRKKKKKKRRRRRKKKKKKKKKKAYDLVRREAFYDILTEFVARMKLVRLTI